MEGIQTSGAQARPPAPGAIIRRAGPRLVRDAFGPLATFFIGWKLIGLGAGIAMAVLFGLSVFLHERHQERPAALIRVSLMLVALRAIVGLSSGSASVYLAQEIGIDALLTITVLGSLAAGKPISAWIAADVFPFTQEMRSSETFTHIMRTVSLVWGLYFLTRGLVRLTALLTLSTNSYVLVVALSEAPVMLALLAWSVHYTTRRFRGSEQWGVLFAKTGERWVPRQQV